ncbi:hypothetical protein ARMGADRAFT_1007362 [Armillaria gallica]|uniref:Uncharacterized protein n=1 Tax=Armillaria gallica TaxID=47427 RepID=A0A2H3EKE5_ARMGA|nr:hypothetical protein ARMGADRAFT_1007362 [Armillaria gallica]
MVAFLFLRHIYAQCLRTTRTNRVMAIVLDGVRTLTCERQRTMLGPGTCLCLSVLCPTFCVRGSTSWQSQNWEETNGRVEKEAGSWELGFKPDVNSKSDPKQDGN